MEELINELRKQGLMVYTIESITAGGIAAKLASVAGSSAWLYGGIICYNEQIKRDLGVTAPDIYTPECARQMADYGALAIEAQLARNDIVVLAITGKVFGESDIAVWNRGMIDSYHLEKTDLITDRVEYQAFARDVALGYLLATIQGKKYYLPDKYFRLNTDFIISALQDRYLAIIDSVGVLGHLDTFGVLFQQRMHININNTSRWFSKHMKLDDELNTLEGGKELLECAIKAMPTRINTVYLAVFSEFILVSYNGKVYHHIVDKNMNLKPLLQFALDFAGSIINPTNELSDNMEALEI